jgi:hypothetical protein
MNVGFLGPIRIMLDTDGIAQLIQEFFGVWVKKVQSSVLEFAKLMIQSNKIRGGAFRTENTITLLLCSIPKKKHVAANILYSRSP